MVVGAFYSVVSWNSVQGWDMVKENDKQTDNYMGWNAYGSIIAVTFNIEMPLQ